MLPQSQPFLGEIRIISFGFPPPGWAFCNGALLPISSNEPLFSILGITYGGDGVTNFALPDLRGRTPIHVGSGFVVGDRGGEPAHVLSIVEMPAHAHRAVVSSNTGSTPNPAGAFWAGTAAGAYSANPNTSLGAQAIASAGGNQPHLNLSPFLVLNFVISLTGIFPAPA